MTTETTETTDYSEYHRFAVCENCREYHVDRDYADNADYLERLEQIFNAEYMPLHFADPDEYPVDEFSIAPCGFCGSRSGGTRHTAFAMPRD